MHSLTHRTSPCFSLSCSWRNALWLNAMHRGKKWWIREFVPPYIFPLNPDYVAARFLRSLRSNYNTIVFPNRLWTDCVGPLCWTSVLDLCSQQSEFFASVSITTMTMWYFSRQTRDKLSSIFPALAGDHKVASQGFIRTRSVRAYLKLTQGFDLFLQQQQHFYFLH